MNLASILAGTAADHGDRIALRVDDETVDYNGFLERARTAAGVIRGLGAQPGDRVGLVSPNLPAFPVVFYGALMAGCAVVPMNPLLTSREIDYYLSDSGAVAVIAVQSVADATREAAGKAGIPALVVGADGVPVTESSAGGTSMGTESSAGGTSMGTDGAANDPLQAEVERDGSDLAVILYTSGTTGQPKGALLSHDNLISNAATSADTLVEATPDDVIMGCLPLFHVFGLTCGLNASVRAGASLALLPRFDPKKALATIAKHRVTVFEGVPTMYVGMLGAEGEYDTSSLRTCLSGGAAMPVEVMRGFEERYGCQVLEGYGLSETSPVASFNQPGQERKPGSIGTAVRGMEIRLVDELGADVPAGGIGEIAIRGEGVMSGYHGRPEATAESIPDGWFRSGDLARVDDDGYIFIVDRKKQMIIRGGYNVYPREIEEVFYEYPAVAEVAVVGLEHSQLGQEVGAAVVVKPGESFDAEKIRAFVKERVAAYKYPRHIWQVEALPKGPTGKVQHREVVVPDDVVVE